MLQKEFNYYKKHQKELLKQFEWRTIVIVGEDVVGVYDNEQQAYSETIKKHKLGKFLIQTCVKDENLAMFHSRVVF